MIFGKWTTIEKMRVLLIRGTDDEVHVHAEGRDCHALVRALRRIDPQLTYLAHADHPPEIAR